MKSSNTCFLIVTLFFIILTTTYATVVSAGDDNIEGLFFSENYEDSDLHSRDWYDGGKFEITKKNPYAGKGCIEYRWKAKTTSPVSSSGSRHPIEPTEVVYLRFYIRLSEGWGWSGRSYHPHMMHFLTTENSAYHGPASSHLTLYIEPVNGKLRLGATDMQNKDAPHGLTQGELRGGYNGKLYDSKEVLFDDAKWHCIEAMFKLNSLDMKNDKPNLDGQIQGWFDGKLVIEHDDILFRTTDFPNMKFNQFIVTPYFGPGLLPHAQTLWIDELAVGNKRIGRLKKKPYILTPKPSDKPRINGAKIFGVRPNRPFLFTIPATGKRPMVFSAQNLPKGLKLDKDKGQITGSVDNKGKYSVTLRAENSLGTAERQFNIIVGDKICLTPPMGWNSWNCWAAKVSADNVRASAEAMAKSGLINHGWTYINIDDTWQDRRGGKFFAIMPNEKFGDMQGLCDYVHSLGLKIGIYSTPWVTSYAGYIGGSSDNKEATWEKIEGWDNYTKNHRHGKYKFDKNDAKKWAQWGIDYLKYDWNPNDAISTKRMADALLASGRDIVYSLSNSAPFDGAADWARLANCWRTTGDIRDGWNRGYFDKSEQWAFGIRDIWQSHRKWEQFTGPGHWSDPDMLVVGQVGWGKLHPSRLSPDEQYTHISLWCLWSAPLLLGCPLDKLDDFTLNLLTNDEVLEVNQDPLGKQAKTVTETEDTEVLAKDMEDGSKAVGLFNLAVGDNKVKVKWSELGIKGKQVVRDLWRQKDLGTFDGSFEAKVPEHGVVLVKITPAAKH